MFRLSRLLRVDVGVRRDQIRVDVVPPGDLTHEGEGALIGFRIRASRVLTLLVDQVGVQQPMLRRHLAGRATGRAVTDPFRLDHSDPRPGLLEEQGGSEPRDPRPDDNDVGLARSFQAG
ncbi:MAG: hypothetical protein M3252_02305 [Actinomycetota bacterium]|nr:hypothetical protein [Actinomycetota bacterium]